MNHVDAFRRGFAAVLVVSMFALAVAPASAGQKQGTGKALASPSEVVASRGGGSGKALASPSDALLAREDGTGEAPPSVAVVGLDAVGGATPAVAPA